MLPQSVGAQIDAYGATVVDLFSILIGINRQVCLHISRRRFQYLVRQWCKVSVQLQFQTFFDILLCLDVLLDELDCSGVGRIQLVTTQLLH